MDVKTETYPLKNNAGPDLYPNFLRDDNSPGGQAPDHEQRLSRTITGFHQLNHQEVGGNC